MGSLVVLDSDTSLNSDLIFFKIPVWSDPVGTEIHVIESKSGIFSGNIQFGTN